MNGLLSLSWSENTSLKSVLFIAFLSLAVDEGGAGNFVHSLHGLLRRVRSGIGEGNPVPDPQNVLRH